MVAGLATGLGRLAGAFKSGLNAAKVGDVVRRFAVPTGEAFQALSKEGAMAVGETVRSNAAARLGNFVGGPQFFNDAAGAGIGIALGQNPVSAIAGQVVGRKVGALAGNAVRGSRGAESMTAKAVELATDLGISYGTHGLVDGAMGMVFGDAETEARQQMTAMQSQRQMPSNGINRQFADVANAQGALQQPARPDGRQFADAGGGGMVSGNVVIPPLDAATADKLLKRARENAQKEMFAVDSLTDLMGTF